MIYEVEDNFVISSHQIWLPGSFDTRQTAQYAFQFKDEILQKLQDSVNPGGVITMQMLKEARKI